MDLDPSIVNLAARQAQAQGHPVMSADDADRMLNEQRRSLTLQLALGLATSHTATAGASGDVVEMAREFEAYLRNG